MCLSVLAGAVVIACGGAGAAFVAPVGAVSTAGPTVSVQVIEAGPKAGDLLLRRSSTVLGGLVRSIDRETSYSHVGILVTLPTGGLGVAHLVPDQPSAIVEPIDEFLDPQVVTGAALLRLVSTAPEQDLIPGRAAAVASALVAAGVTFDRELDPNTDDRMYCTEFVWKAYAGAGVDLGPPKAIPLLDKPVFLVSSLAASPLLETIASY